MGCNVFVYTFRLFAISADVQRVCGARMESRRKSNFEVCVCVYVAIGADSCWLIDTVQNKHISNNEQQNLYEMNNDGSKRQNGTAPTHSKLQWRDYCMLFVKVSNSNIESILKYTCIHDII